MLSPNTRLAMQNTDCSWEFPWTPSGNDPFPRQDGDIGGPGDEDLSIDDKNPGCSKGTGKDAI